MAAIHGLFWLVMLLSTALASDRVHLRNGKVLVGDVIERKTRFVVIEVDGKKKKVSRKKILKITDAKGNIRWVDAYKFATAHYSFTTNVPREQADSYAKSLEQLYAWFMKEFKKDWKLHKVKRMGVNIYRLRKEFQQGYRELATAKGAIPDGAYLPMEERLLIPAEGKGGFSRGNSTLFHEGGHQILHLAANFLGGERGQPRHWINESIPCYFEHLVLKQGKLVNGLSHHRIFATVKKIRRNQHHPLDEFDMLTREQYSSKEYSQGYTLAFFFMTAEGGKYRKRFLQYAREIWLTRARPDTFKKLFGQEIGAFEADWKKFTLGLEKEASRRVIEDTKKRKRGRPGGRG